MTGARRLVSLFVLSALLLLLVAAPGCGTSTRADRVLHTVTVAGSTSVQPFAEMLAEEFMARNRDIVVNVQGGGSSAGVRAAQSGAAAIGTLSRELKKEEAGLDRHILAWDAIAVVVHRSNPVRDLSREQIRAIFAGEITRWSQVGGPDRAIHVITREEGSGTRGAFDELIMGKDAEITSRALVQDSNGSVRETVAGDRYAIGYISLGLVDERVLALAIDGTPATEENARTKKYTLIRPFLLVTRGEPAGAAREFLEFCLGPEGQAVLKGEGLIPARAVFD